MISAFLTGCVAGLAIAMPIGAVAALIIVTSATRGWRIGAAAGLGTATVDTVYASVAVLAGGVIAPLVVGIATPLRWLSAIVLAAIGGVMVANGLRSRTSVAGSSTGMLDSPRKAYLTVMAITAVNPATVVYFVALVVGSPMGDIDGVGIAVAFVLGVGLASAAWQLLIAGGGAVLGRVLSGEAAHRWTSIVGGLVVLALAVRTALGA